MHSVASCRFPVAGDENDYRNREPATGNYFSSLSFSCCSSFNAWIGVMASGCIPRRASTTSLARIEQRKLPPGQAAAGLLDEIALLALERGEDLAGPVGDRSRDAGESGHLDSVTLVRRAGYDFAQEDDLIVPFLDRDIEVCD